MIIALHQIFDHDLYCLHAGFNIGAVGGDYQIGAFIVEGFQFQKSVYLVQAQGGHKGFRLAGFLICDHGGIVRLKIILG